MTSLSFTPHMANATAKEAECHEPSLPHELPILSHPLMVSAVDPATLNSEHSDCQIYTCMFCDHVSDGEVSISLHVAEVHKCRSLFFCTECDYQCSVKELLATHVASHVWVSYEMTASLDDNVSKEVIVKQECPDDTEMVHTTTESNNLKLTPGNIKVRKKEKRAVDRNRKSRALEDLSSSKSEKLQEGDPSFNVDTIGLDNSNWIKDHHPKKPKLKFKTFSALTKMLKSSPNVIMNVSPNLFAQCDSFSCYICGFVTKKFTYFKDHFMLHFDFTPFVCKHCGAGFVSKQRLTKHVKSVHASDRQFLCQSCPYRAKTSECLKKHMKLMHPVDEDLKYECSDCQAKFSLRRCLEDHKRLTHEQCKKFVCDLCNFSSNFYPTMETHTNKHLGITHLCPICGREYASKNHMTRHLQTHNIDAVYQCDRCPFLAKSQQSLRGHSRVHSNKRPYKCSMCSYKAKTSSAVHVHMKSHRLERKFTCIECGKSFKFKHHLERHHEQHANLQLACGICDYRGQSTAAYQRHMLLHNPSRRHNCGMCERYFATKGELLTHMEKAHGAGEAFTVQKISSNEWTVENTF